jgi:hypothetical protein
MIICYTRVCSWVVPPDFLPQAPILAFLCFRLPALRALPLATFSEPEATLRLRPPHSRGPPLYDFRYCRPISVKLPEISTSTKCTRNSRRICTSTFIGFKAHQNQHLRKKRRGGRAVLSVRQRRRVRSSFVAPACHDLSRVSREFRGSFEGAPRAHQAAPLVFRVPHLLRFVQQVGLRSATRLGIRSARRPPAARELL